MSRQFNLTVRQEPFWLQEAFACMNYVHMLDSGEWLERSGSRSRQSRRQKEEFLLPYRSYREAMRDRLQPVLAQYPLLAGYVDPAPRDQEGPKSQEPPIMEFLVQMQDVLEAEERPLEEKLEEELNTAFQRMLDVSLEDSPDGDELIINGLPDVMAALERWGGTDADKFKLVQLYTQRREVMEQLWSFQGSCVEIGRECLEPVRECFHACMEELKKPDTVEKYFEKTGIRCEGEYCGQITPVILPCRRVMIQIRALRTTLGQSETKPETRSETKPEMSSETKPEMELETKPETKPEMEPETKLEMKLHVGIDLFSPSHAEEGNLYHDERLLLRLKALSDPARLKIIHQLAERPCYLQEMAKMLGLTAATVLHHLGVLLSEGLIEIQATSEKKKIYYQVRKQGLQETGQGILRLAMTREEQEVQSCVHKVIINGEAVTSSDGKQERAGGIKCFDI